MLGLLLRWHRRLLRSIENELPVLQQPARFCLTPRVLNLTTSLLVNLAIVNLAIVNLAIVNLAIVNLAIGEGDT